MRRLSLTVLCIVLMAAAGASYAQAPDVFWMTWAEEDGGNGHDYGVVVTTQSWGTQKQDAVDYFDAHLVSITSADEQGFVEGLINAAEAEYSDDQYYWVGLEQDPQGVEPDGGWGWTTGETLEYENWAAGEPNDQGTEDAGCINSNGGMTWIDGHDWFEHRAVIEREGPSDVSAPTTVLNDPDPSVLPWTGTTPVLVSGTVIDDLSGVASATLTIDDEYDEADAEYDVAVLLDGAGDFELTVDLSSEVAAHDEDGRTYLVTLTATDNEGNASDPATKTVLAPADADAPDVTLNDPDPSVLPYTGTASVLISGAVTDELSGVASATLTIDDEYGEADATYDVAQLLDDAGSFELTVDLSSEVAAGDADGRTYAVTLTAEDVVGNSATATKQVLARADTTPPATSLDEPEAPSDPSRGPLVPVTISGSATDAESGIAEVSLAVVDEYGELDAGYDVTDLLDDAGEFTTTIELSFEVRDGDADGRTYEIALTAADNAGNIADPVVVTLVASAGGDTAPPSVSLDRPRPPRLPLWPIFRPKRVWLSGTVTDEGSGVASAVISVKDEYGCCEPVRDVTGALKDDGRFRTAVYLWAWVKFRDWDGRQYEITLTAVDEAGNEATDTVGVHSPHPWARWRRWWRHGR